MFGIGLPELLIILVVALIVVGPRKLPSLAKSLGKGLNEFRRATDEIKSGLTENETYKDISEIKNSVKETVDSMKPEGILDIDAVIEPKKPEPDLNGRKQLMSDVVAEHEQAQNKEPTGDGGQAAEGEARGAADAAQGDQPPNPKTNA